MALRDRVPSYCRSMARTCSIGSGETLTVGAGARLVVIAGPCTLESFEMGLAVGRVCRDACSRLGLGYIFKASFDKANRTSIDSPRGPGAARGLDWLGTIGRELGVATTTDLHEPAQADAVASVVDLIQIPAFLCRQTDLLVAAGAAAGAHSRAVNIKKGQFLSPGEMAGPVRKVMAGGCDQIILTERGTFFGYHRLVNDFVGMGELMELDCPGGPPPVCYDATHSTQRPGLGETTGGARRFTPMLARAAVAAGVHALFVECHPDPDHAASDAGSQVPLAQMPGLLEQVARIREAMG